MQTAEVLPFICGPKKRKITLEGGTMGKVAAKTITSVNGNRLTINDLKLFHALTTAQQDFYDLYDNGNTAIMCHGVAGTGKTFIALYKGLEDVLDKKSQAKQLVLMRSCVAGRDIGFLPGSIEEKSSVYTDPYIGMCSTMFGPHNAWDKLVEQGTVKFLTTSFLRGITLDNSIVILDEAQNTSWQEISTVMTRIGNNSKIIFCGDFRQTDLSKKNDMSGLSKFVDITRMMPSFRSVEFTTDDIVRGSLVKEFILANIAYDDNQHKAF